ncbi:MAG TPA: tetratricopeptide repeat protein, partial [Pyrinomonadaceae bacterium]|nr:tetratricopeptide repeat protein [Pyrinomonadaceae bacterium]
MRPNAILRAVAMTSAALALSLGIVTSVFAQDVGADVGGGAGIFRAKNPEAKKRSATATKPAGRTTGPTRPRPSNVAERVEDLLDKGNEARDARNFAQAEDAYKEILKLKLRDARAAYGLGNVYADQQRWEDAEAAYRNSIAWAPNDADAYVALSVVLVQPRAEGDNAKRFSDAESFARRSVQLDPKNAVGWDRLGVALQARGLTNSETEHSYRRAIELDPEFAVAYAHLARMLNRAKRPA